jgi:hypothetical protein
MSKGKSGEKHRPSLGRRSVFLWQQQESGMSYGYHWNDYVPITIEARQPNGRWWVRNSFVFENSQVQGGEKTRAWLINIANSFMYAWSKFDSKQLRITGIPQRVLYKREESDHG